MDVMLAECRVWGEDAGTEVLATPHPGAVEITIIRDGEAVAAASIARWRWDRIVQAMLPPPGDLVSPGKM